ncbi:MAG: erythromycin esterase family protein [Gillisia sp.]
MSIDTDFSEFYHPLKSTPDLDPLMKRIGDANYVLLGEASHGTHEYYTWRTEITKRLIQEKGFTLIAVEGDWPDCYKINQWIKEDTNEKAIQDVLMEFTRWPTWMWANWEIAALATWLKEFNAALAYDKKIGFYGLDVYSLWESMDQIVDYLEKEDPDTAVLAKEAVRCFEPFREDDSYTSVFSMAQPSCKEKVLALLQRVRLHAHNYDHQKEAGLNAELNSLVMANAEKYYESMVSFGEQSWNVRDNHMVETLNTLMDYHDPNAKVIIWEHNTHIGDARATDMASQGLVNVGQLLREQQNRENVVLVGFSSYSGSVIAGRGWGATMQDLEVPPAISGSVEAMLHQHSATNKLIVFNEDPQLEEAFSEKLPHRAIGVVYNPNYERGNYVPSRLSLRYDAFIFIDETRALHPLKLKPDGNKVPDTFPFGF